MTYDLAFAQPSMTAGEQEMLLFSLDRARAQFAWKTGDLSAEALHRPFPPSAMTLAGLLKHMAWVEDHVVCRRLTDEPPSAPWNEVDWKNDPDWEFRTAKEDSPEYLYGLWEDAVERSREAWAKALADGGPDAPARGGAWKSMEQPPNLRRILVDVSDEYCRHAGHADLFREAIDGLVGEDPPQPE